MAEPHIDRLLDRLAVEFDAAVVREESEAATDLALSLAQSSPLSSTLARLPSEIVLPGGVRAWVEAVGEDYLEGRIPHVFVPIARAVVRESEDRGSRNGTCARPRELTGVSLVQALRVLVRRGPARVTVATHSGEVQGVLDAVGPDFIAIRANRRHLFGMGALNWLRIDGEAS